MQRDQDSVLVENCLSGDRKAFELLVQKYEKKLYNVAYRIVGDPEDAMDATQSTFVKAFEKLHTFDPKYRFFSWVYRILLNESLTMVHQKKRFEPWESDVVDGRSASSPSPSETFDETEINQQIQKAMRVLKPDYRVVIVLKHFHGMSYREMAEITGVPEKTVKSRLFTARQQLKDILEEQGIVR